jgi:hypothetical protein
MLGRDVERREIVEIVLDMRPFGDGEAHLAEDRDEFVDRLADRMDAALGLGPDRQRDVDPLGRQPCLELARRQPPGGALDGGGNFVLEGVEGRAGRLAGLRVERAEALHPLGNAALAAERGDAHLLQRLAARRGVDRGLQVAPGTLEFIHRICQS